MTHGRTLSASDLDRIARLERLCTQARDALPDEPIPCFAHLRLARAGAPRDVLLGPRTVAEGPVTILHWQIAPLAGVFFSTGEGDDYELDVEGRALEGRVLEKALLTLDHRTLREVITPGAVFARDDAGAWVKRAALAPLLTPHDPTIARLPPPWTLDALDADQRRAVDLPASRALLALGEAGCGKTTVALHRAAELNRRATREGRPFRALVVVPVEGLRRLSESLLARLGAPDVEVRVFDRWAAVQARRAFPGIPRRESRDAPPAVVRLKRHPALREAIAAVAARPRKSVPKAQMASANRSDLHHLFGDRALLERVCAATDGAVLPHHVEQVIEHTRRQFRETSEQAWSHVTDRERMQTLDALRLDDGTPDEDAGSIDAEDYPVLFAISQLRGTPTSRPAAPDTYDCVVIDEAQEFAPLELQLIARAVRRGGTLIVAGDEGQQVDTTSYFSGWDDTMRELGAKRFETVRLAVSYRCPPAVTELARHVLRPSHVLPAEDPAVVRFTAPTMCHLTARLVDALRALRVSDPQASVAVICRAEETAERMAAQLARGEDVHLVRGGDFRFVPGIEVACVQDVKGLEFDHVVIPDANAITYPDAGDARRALYVAATRASVQLAVGSVGAVTPLL